MAKPAHRCKHGIDHGWLTCGACAKESRALAAPDPGSPVARQWIIQRRLDAFRNEYEDWPGYCERSLTRPEMLTALKECEERWPAHEFRGHNVAHQRPPLLRYVVKLGRNGARPQLYDAVTKSEVRPYATVAEAERQAMLLNRLIRPGLLLESERCDGTGRLRDDSCDH